MQVDEGTKNTFVPDEEVGRGFGENEVEIERIEEVYRYVQKFGVKNGAGMGLRTDGGYDLGRLI